LWQVRFNSSDVEVIPPIGKPVDPRIVDELLLKFADFQRAYTEGGLSTDDSILSAQPGGLFANSSRLATTSRR
jgi:hypothetical protein